MVWGESGAFLLDLCRLGWRGKLVSFLIFFLWRVAVCCISARRWPNWSLNFSKVHRRGTTGRGLPDGNGGSLVFNNLYARTQLKFEVKVGFVVGMIGAIHGESGSNRDSCFLEPEVRENYCKYFSKG